MRRKYHWRRTTTLAALLLCSCTSIKVADDPLVQSARQAAQPGGTAIVSLTANTLEVRQFDSIRLQRVQDQGVHIPLLEHQTLLNNVLHGTSRDTTLFVGALDPGVYQMIELTSGASDLALPENTLSSFHVQSGQVTDLGRLVLTSVNEEGLVGRSATIVSNQDFVRQYSPEHLSLYGTTPPRGWDEPRSDGDGAEFYARSHPLGTMGFRRLQGGAVVGAARMGTLLLREPDGQWRTAVSGKLEGFTATVPYEVPGYLAVAVGEAGSLVRLRDNGLMEPVDRGDLPAGSLFFVDATPDWQHWVVGLQRDGAVQFYSSSRLDHGHWEVLGAITIDTSLWLGEPHVWAWHLPGGFGFASNTNGFVSCFDYGGSGWHKASTADQRLMHSVLVAENGTIGSIERSPPGRSGPPYTMHWSVDCGASWHAVAFPTQAEVSAPLRFPDGLLLASGRDAQGDGVFASRDEGAHWNKISQEPVLDERITQAGPLLLAVSARHGVEQVLVSRDRGAHWATEIDRVEPHILELQRGRRSGH